MERHHKILLLSVDDVNRTSLKELLSCAFNLILTDSIEQGLEVLHHTQEIGCVLCDHHFLEENKKYFSARSPKKFSNIPILVAAGYETPWTKSEARSLGIHTIITKPYSTEKFLKALESV